MLSAKPILKSSLVALPPLVVGALLFAADRGQGVYAIMALLVAGSGAISGTLAYRFLQAGSEPPPVFEDDVLDIVRPLPPLRAIAMPPVEENVARPAADLAPVVGIVRTATQESLVALEEMHDLAAEVRQSLEGIAAKAGEAAASARTAIKSTGDAADKAQGLNDALHRINAMIYTVQMIAEQSNLLALNATIEAARAGEAGLGFSAVASEVKSLATETGRSTREIANLFAIVSSAAAAANGANGTITQQMASAEEASRTVARLVQEFEIKAESLVRRSASAATLARSARDHVDQAAAKLG